jgi:hypothetical protein
MQDAKAKDLAVSAINQEICRRYMEAYWTKALPPSATTTTSAAYLFEKQASEQAT